MKRVLVLGASRGLGAELVKCLAESQVPALGFARKPGRLVGLAAHHPKFEFRSADFSSAGGQELVLSALQEEEFSHVIVVAGGGPYGKFGAKQWKDQEWALEVTLLFPARVVHALLASGKTSTQIVLVGSSVAEYGPDPMAAAYSAAKHGLKGLYASLREEIPEWDIRLFSPGYMDTEMLPANAAVRQLGVWSPALVARELWDWALSADKSGHKLYPKHPS